MKRSILTAAMFFIITFLPIFGKNYNYTKTVGKVDVISEFRNYPSAIIPEPESGKISAWQQLPFEWEFYGEKVDGYFISDDGYITFDKNATQTYMNNTPLPDISVPNNAIYGFWHHFVRNSSTSEWGQTIRTQTRYEAPNRVHIIYFISMLSRANTSNNGSFALAIYENGGFSITYVAGRTSHSFVGSAGCENKDGTIGVQIEGTQDLVYPAVTADPNDDITYAFQYSNYDTDAELTGTNLPVIAKINEDLKVSFTVKNVATLPIESFKTNIKINDNEPLSQVFSGLNLLSNTDMVIDFATTITMTEAGSFHNVSIWIDNVNNGNDLHYANDTLTRKVFTVLGQSAQKNVLVEEFTGAWCGWCPDGGLQMKEIEKHYPGSSLVAIHAGSSADNMKIQAGLEIANYFHPSYPQAMVDRIKFPENLGVPFSRGVNAWIAAYEKVKDAPSPLYLNIEHTFDKSTRVILGNLKVHVVDYIINDDIRVNLWLTENNLSGSGTGWDQANSYSGNNDYPNHPLFKESNPIKDYVHRFVLRESLTGTFGQAEFQTPPQPGEEINIPINFTLPTGYNSDEVSFVAFVAYHNSSLFGHQVLNSIKVRLVEPDNVNIADSETTSISCSPNPASDYIDISINSEVSAFYDVYLIDNLGRKLVVVYKGDIFSEKRTFNIPVYNLSSGIYFIVSKSVNGTFTEMIQVIK